MNSTGRSPFSGGLELDLHSGTAITTEMIFPMKSHRTPDVLIGSLLEMTFEA